jgi:hypothetical protein
VIGTSEAGPVLQPNKVEKSLLTVTVFITIHKRNCTDLIIWHTHKNKIYKTDLRYEFAVFRSWK